MRHCRAVEQHLSEQHHHAEQDSGLRDLQEGQQVHALVLRLRTRSEHRVTLC